MLREISVAVKALENVVELLIILCNEILKTHQNAQTNLRKQYYLIYTINFFSVLVFA